MAEHAIRRVGTAVSRIMRSRGVALLVLMATVMFLGAVVWNGGL